MTLFEMDKRRSELSKLTSYIQRIDSEVTMVLQSLQWDPKHLIEGSPMAACKYDPNHAVPPGSLNVHQMRCRLRSAGHRADEQLLPEPFDADAVTLVTLNKNDITNIIDYATKIDPLFRKGRGSEEWQPLSLERLQEAYSTDERRAIHDAVVSAVPSCHDPLELALPGGGGARPASPGKSRAAVLAELRDMKRRRTKYRGAAKTRNYSDELRDLIATQMEHYSGSRAAVGDAVPAKGFITNQEAANSTRYEEVHIKKEPERGESRRYSRDHASRLATRDEHKERDGEKRRDGHKRDRNRDERDRYSSSSKESSRGTNEGRSRDKCRRDDEQDSRHSRSMGHRENSKSLGYSDRRKHERGDRYGSHGRSREQDRHTRYYGSKQDCFESTEKLIKREKD